MGNLRNNLTSNVKFKRSMSKISRIKFTNLSLMFSPIDPDACCLKICLNGKDRTVSGLKQKPKLLNVVWMKVFSTQIFNHET